MAIKVVVTFGLGNAVFEERIYVSDGTPDYQIEELASDKARETFWWHYEVESE